MPEGMELIDNQIKKKFIKNSGSGDSESVHAHASHHLIEVYEVIDTGKKDDKGEPIMERQLLTLEALIPKSEIVAPQGFTALWEYINWYEEAFVSRKNRSHLREIPKKYAISMTGKDRKARLESVQVYTASALSQQNPDEAAAIRQVKDS